MSSPCPDGSGLPGRSRGRRHNQRALRLGVANYPQFYVPRGDVAEDSLVDLDRLRSPREEQPTFTPSTVTGPQRSQSPDC